MELLMPIDIDQFTEDELRDLHRCVTKRLWLIQQVRANVAMMNFSIGERVAFAADGRRIIGVLARYNRKTVKVIADDGHRWSVSPGLLSNVDSPPERMVVATVPGEGSRLPARTGRDHGARS